MHNQQLLSSPDARIRAFLMAGLVLLGGCNGRSDEGPVVVSAIGGPLQLGVPFRKVRDTPARLLLDSTAQGLVRFDASGQIEPGIAERWIVIDGGLRYIFRLRDAEWSDGRPVAAAEVVTVLRRDIARGSGNPLLPFLTAIDEVVEMTPEVIEVRLTRPRPDLLKLFAQPELAIFRTRPPGGSGPFRVVPSARQGTMLRPAFDPARSSDDNPREPPPEADVRLIGERAAKAIARFAAKQSDLVAGGSFVDWPLLATTGIAPLNQRIDPAAGLFGLAVARRSGFLADPGNRAAIAGTIDRARLTAAFTSAWNPINKILPDQLDSATTPTVATWAILPVDVDAARARVDTWRRDHPGPIRLRIALPGGPGGTIFYGYLGATLLSLGIEPVRVSIDASDADLRLIDAVAPYDSARWYIATACQPCGADATKAIEQARNAPNLILRGKYIAQADVALAADVAFIPIARPLRWSLVSLRLQAWTGNARAWHPLNHLRNDTN